MKKTLTTLLLLLVMVAGFSVQAQNKAAAPKMVFEEDSHDFGQIKEGVVAEYDFKFKNTGDAPLVLKDVRASCGCTTPEWPKEPIAPSKSGIIKAKYNSANRPGAFSKSITITTNIEGEVKVLFIKGEVVRATDNQMSDPNQSPVRVRN